MGNRLKIVHKNKINTFIETNINHLRLRKHYRTRTCKTRNQNTTPAKCRPVQWTPAKSAAKIEQTKNTIRYSLKKLLDMNRKQSRVNQLHSRLRQHKNSRGKQKLKAGTFFSKHDTTSRNMGSVSRELIFVNKIFIC